VTSSVVIGYQQLSPIISSCENVSAAARDRHFRAAQQRRHHRLKIVFPCTSSSPVVRHRYLVRTVTVTSAEGSNTIAVVHPQRRRIVAVTPPHLVRNAAVASSSAVVRHRAAAASSP
jgi:hypothetical protein